MIEVTQFGEYTDKDRQCRRDFNLTITKIQCQDSGIGFKTEKANKQNKFLNCYSNLLCVHPFEILNILAFLVRNLFSDSSDFNYNLVYQTIHSTTSRGIMNKK